MRRVLRWVIPADDKWHRIDAPKESIVHVATRAEPYAEVWTMPYAEVWTMDDGQPGESWLRVFGTGHEITEGAYIGTAVTPSGRLVWHVFAKEA